MCLLILAGAVGEGQTAYAVGEGVKESAVTWENLGGNVTK